MIDRAKFGECRLQRRGDCLALHNIDHVAPRGRAGLGGDLCRLRRDIGRSIPDRYATTFAGKTYGNRPTNAAGSARDDDGVSLEL